MFSPLEQFDILYIMNLGIRFLDLSITNSTIFLILVFSYIFLFLLLNINRIRILPFIWFSILESIYEFTVTLVFGNCNVVGQKYFPFIFVLFLFLLTTNLLGMVPYSFTLTSHLIFTFSLALVIFIGINIVGIREHKLKYFNLFLPPGAPLAIAPFIILIELISYFSRVFSLAIRLFANMMSGHTLLKILAGFAWTMLLKSNIWLFLFLIPFIIVFIVTAVEIGIAFLQAYVFTILVCIYLHDVLYMH